MALFRVVSEIFNVEEYRELEIQVEPIKVIESGIIRQTGYSFLLVFYSNFVPKTKRYSEIFDLQYAIYNDPISSFLGYSMWKNIATLKSGSEVNQGH